MRKAIRRGDLFYADLNPVVGSEQGGIRPVLVIQNDVGNHFSPTVVAAQTADDLLEIFGIQASFVFTYYQSKVYISARSIDEVNVHVIMEKLGGGGHQNVAGAQVEGSTVEESIGILKTIIDNMHTEGEL